MRERLSFVVDWNAPAIAGGTILLYPSGDTPVQQVNRRGDWRVSVLTGVAIPDRNLTEERSHEMRKLLTTLIAVAFAAVTSSAIAQAQPATPATPATPAQPDKPKADKPKAAKKTTAEKKKGEPKKAPAKPKGEAKKGDGKKAAKPEGTSATVK